MDFKKLTAAIGNLEEDEVMKMLNEFMEGEPEILEAQDVISASQAGMKMVGELFENGEYFVGDLIYAGEILSAATKIIKPALKNAVSDAVGKIVIGTVKGDLHDIGKNIFINMVEAAGFAVYDLGIDQPASNFISKIEEINPHIVGMSGLLTLAVDPMKEIVDEIKKAGLRDSVKIIIGGNIVSEEVSRYVGSDGYTANAQEGVDICVNWINS